VCVKIYALKPFEADIGSISPAVESSTLSPVPTADERGTSGDVTVSPTNKVVFEHGAKLNTKL